MPYWEHFSHDADIGIRGIGDSLEEAFEMAGMSLTAIVTDLENLSSQFTVHIHCQENNIELLFYDWINALVYEMDTKKIILKKFQVHINQGFLDASCEGQKMHSTNLDLAVEVKGATMTELKVIQKDGQWIAQCIVDV